MAFQGMDPEPSHGSPQEVARLLDAPASLQDVGEQVVVALKSVYDPEIPVDIYELGLIYNVKIDEGGATSIRMTLTSPMCPAAEELPPEVESKARSVPGVTSVTLDLVWDPPWSPEMMSEAARLELGMLQRPCGDIDILHAYPNVDPNTHLDQVLSGL